MRRAQLRRHAGAAVNDDPGDGRERIQDVADRAIRQVDVENGAIGRIVADQLERFGDGGGGADENSAGILNRQYQIQRDEGFILDDENSSTFQHGGMAGAAKEGAVMSDCQPGQ